MIAVTLALLLGADAPKAPEAKLSMEEVQEITRSVTPRIEQIRGLKFKRPVAVKIVDDATARAHFQAQIKKEYPEGKIQADERAYAQLGLIPPGAKLLPAFLDVLEEQAGGFYDTETETFYVLDDMAKSIAPLIVAHELTHALDDQHYDLDATLAKVRDNDDRSTAYGAVVEGSGTLVSTVFVTQEIQAGRLSMSALVAMAETEAGQGKRLAAALPLVRRSLLATYSLGSTFLVRGDLMRAMNLEPADLNRAFAEPPTSSEQLLHPEKYWDVAKVDVPVSVTLPDVSAALGGGWSRAGGGTLGELFLAMMAGEATPDALVVDPGLWTNAAAAGLGGDAYALFVKGDQAVTLLGTAWDTASDAEEFEKALPAQPGRKAFRSGTAVVLVAGDAGDRAAAVASMALDSLTLAARPRQGNGR